MSATDRIPEFVAAVSGAFKELFETKHHFQSAHVKTDDLLHKVPKRRRLRKDESIVAATLRSIPNDLRRTDALFDNIGMKLAFRRPWELENATAVPEAGQRTLPIPLPTIRIPCSGCDGVTPPHRPQVEAGSGWMRRLSAADTKENPTQLFAIAYQCQNCGSEPLVFLVRREGLKLTLVGRSHFERISIPRCVPKSVEKFYRQAVVSCRTGFYLAGLFYLRTLIEQHMLAAVSPPRRLTGEGLAEEYQKLLPRDFPARFPSLKKLYQDLSTALHAADENEELFKSCLDNVKRHFEARSLLGVGRALREYHHEEDH